MNSVESIKEVAIAVVKSSARRPESKAIDIVPLRVMSQCRDILFEPTVLEELMKVDGLSDKQKLLDIQLVWWEAKSHAKDKLIDFQAIRDQLRSKLENN
eukprot:g40962.t1